MTKIGHKDQNIQALRGLAAMLVVALHTTHIFEQHGRTSGLIEVFRLGSHFGALGVDLFFVISGAVMAMAIEHDPRPLAFLRARFCRVVPLFWMAAIVSIGVGMITSGLPLREPLLNSITILPIFDRGIFNTPYPTVGWTLAYELYFYAIVGAALFLPRAMRSDAIAAVLLAGALGGIAMRPIMVPIIGIPFNAILLEFLFGFLALRAARTAFVARYGPWLGVIGVAMLVAGVATGYAFPPSPEAVVASETSMHRVIAWGVPSALILLGVIGREGEGAAPGGLARLGDASYALYLIHLPLFGLMEYGWRWWSPLGGEILFATMLAGAVAAGLAAHRWVERPVLRLLAGRQAASVTASASTVSPRSFTSANPPSTWMRATTVVAEE